ncbi:Putative SH3 domain, transglutaminase, SH3-like domain superfamily [Septoria linicola]|uniref:SH3 domain, transglutaminase, SH3-like domain superfamily n=1 Tax=Septoria linicola TaxID=215465 RepID=A0A9Q9EJ27_9PEZI|nr:putative SH3 domain, transglutaminase, SH3-like domain superfamily [Septoria linicola]USW50928.1 Putative SH3 domain, transglutaminase, SH3-like domain superfamily [Septoria linicola]
MGMPGELPRFPCWCKATYSWGGETKKDLGFIEGDLIEALNAGDGSWWMGRLRRDPRAVGLFPSNFVTVLEESFTPAPNSRNTTPVTQQPKSSISKGKSMFRKPYQAYEVLGKQGSLDNSKEGTPESEVDKKKEKSKFKPYSSMKTAQAPTGTIKKHNGVPVMPQDDGPRIPEPVPRHRHSASRRPRSPQPAFERQAPAHSASPTPTPAPYRNGYVPYRAPSPQPEYHAPLRSRSPLPASYHDGSAYPQMLPMARQPSPAPFDEPAYYSRAPSPLPHDHNQHYSRAPSPYQDDQGEEDLGSSPPPPPPAHRVAYQPSRAPSLELDESMHPGFSRTGTQTPVPPSPSGSHMTPSPLRAAMNDVMSSLHDMSSFSQSPPPVTKEPSPANIWSPDAFEEIRSSTREKSRAQSSLGFASHQQLEDYDISSSQARPFATNHGASDSVSSYVQRMEHQLRHAKSFSDQAPQPPLKDAQYSARPTTSSSGSSQGSIPQQPLRHRKSAYEIGPKALDRTYTTKTNATNSTETSSATQSSNSTQLTSRSIMSGYSAGGFSATSAGSLARRKFGLGSQRERRDMGHTKSTGDINFSTRSVAETGSVMSGPSYHESHASFNQPAITPVADWTKDPMEDAGVLGGMSSPQAKRSGFFKRMIATAKTTARTGAANARSTIGSASSSRPGSRAGSRSPTKSLIGSNGPTAIAGGMASRPQTASGLPARDMGLGGGGDWMQVRRDVNRSNSLSQREREDRAERCEMHDMPAMRPIDQLHEFVEGDESLDGLPITEPTDFNLPNLQLVDKSTRFIQSIPPMTTASSLAQSYVCRPHRSDVQRLRAIFTWVAERITWEEDFEGQTDVRRAIQTKRACSEEIALLVRDMCTTVGLHAEVVRGYLKGPGELLDLDTIARPNHWWNAVIADGEWRMLDCALANPTHPRRAAYSTASSQVAESWYFLTRPMELCYTHIPLLPEKQHIVPPIEHEVLISLPCACPSYFRNNIELANFDTSMLHLQNLEMAHIHMNVPEDVEVVAMTESRGFAQDADGDYFESGDVVTKKAFAQAEWTGGRKRFTIKALLPGDEGQGVLKVYAGKRGLMHSIKDNPHAMAVALPLTHSGQNPPYDFLTRHPTPHAQRHDLYVAQPQCSKLTMNNTFVFCIRQHPSSLSRFTPDTWGASISANGRPQSPNPMIRPSSAMSMVSMTTSNQGSNYGSESSGGDPMTAAQQKPAKLAIQSPSQKIIRLTRKQDNVTRNVEEDWGLTSIWETVIKIGERGTWRGLVLADRSARWCVFAEWECV